jgi:hypothetical protein
VPTIQRSGRCEIRKTGKKKALRSLSAGGVGSRKNALLFMAFLVSAVARSEWRLTTPPAVRANRPDRPSQASPFALLPPFTHTRTGQKLPACCGGEGGAGCSARYGASNTRTNTTINTRIDTSINNNTRRQLAPPEKGSCPPEKDAFLSGQKYGSRSFPFMQYASGWLLPPPYTSRMYQGMSPCCSQ